ncbi:hypothetical protein LTR70_002764 [Exophiala xenobiotica]|uniref:Uncharacterized protein n=1 Tax=Lithohypha guttulata TaxID=1690604 RepID=A0ABR0KK02_9EURO|nr:hypothetical protein LTR24_001871 [Lithohypha guttulata]KAK5324690.1 hypothetical protein LTR70_002764 [Exophiala xenobiotica]
MTLPISLSKTRINIWPSKGTGIPREYLDLEVQYYSDTSCLVIKQFPHLCSTQSYAGYELPRSSFSFVSSEAFMGSERTISLQTHHSIPAMLSIDTSDTGTTTEEEIVTLDMCCTLVDTNIPTSSRLDIITADTTKESENIALLIDTLRKSSFTAEPCLESCKNIESSDSTTNIAPISIGGEDLDRMFSNSTRSSCFTQPDNAHTKQKENRPYHENAGSGSHGTAEKQGRRLPQSARPSKLQNPIKIEHDLKDIAETRAKFWGKEYGVDDAKPPIPASPPRKQTWMRRTQSTNAWEGFAIQHGGQRVRQPQARHVPAAANSFQNATPTAQEHRDNTGGYCLDPHRDYTRADEGNRSENSRRHETGASKRRAFVSPPHVQATFIPHTQNSPAEQQKSPLRIGTKYTERRYW